MRKPLAQSLALFLSGGQDAADTRGDRSLRFELLENRVLMTADSLTGLASAPINAPDPSTSDPTMLLAPQDPTGDASDTNAVAGVSEAVVEQADGSILVAGVSSGDFQLARYHADGTLDTSFGNGGTVTFGDGSITSVQQISLQSDGSCYVAGLSNGSSMQGSTLALIHVGADGSIDKTYGEGGLLTVAGDGDYDAFAFQSDGQLLVAGSNSPGVLSQWSSGQVLERYNIDGTLDASFNGTGQVQLAAGVPVSAITVDSQGNIILAGIDDNGNFDVARYTSDGSLDTTFGDGGTASVAIPGVGNGGVAVAAQSDGKIVLATIATADSGDSSYLVARLNVDGSLDSSFNGNGYALTDIGENVGWTTPSIVPGSSVAGLLVQDDGKIVVTSEAFSQTSVWGPSAGSPGVATPDVLALVTDDAGVSAVRYNADGSVDTSFGGGGNVWYPYSMHEEMAAALQSDGKILLVGTQVNFAPGNVAAVSDVAAVSGVAAFDVIQLDAEGSLDPNFAGNDAALGDPTGLATLEPIFVDPVLFTSITLPTTSVSPADFPVQSTAAAPDVPSSGAPSRPAPATTSTPQFAAPPVIMPQPEIAASAPVITSVTNPPASAAATSMQSPALPQAAPAASFGHGPSFEAPWGKLTKAGKLASDEGLDLTQFSAGQGSLNWRYAGSN